MNNADEDVLPTPRQLLSSRVSANQGEVGQLALRAFLQACDQEGSKVRSLEIALSNKKTKDDARLKVFHSLTQGWGMGEAGYCKSISLWTHYQLSTFPNGCHKVVCIIIIYLN